MPPMLDKKCFRRVVRHMRRQGIYNLIYARMIGLLSANDVSDVIDACYRAIQTLNKQKLWRIYATYYYALFTGLCSTSRDMSSADVDKHF